jgi:DNA polymerase I-like protein with 3'-5' exonuclease and polymerase domains
MPGGRMEAHLMYFGATTGRWSAAGMAESAELNQKESGGVDIRGLLVPAPGRRFLIVDFSQIEARILLWLARDEKTLEVIRSGVSVYDAHARSTMGWKGGALKKENPNL